MKTVPNGSLAFRDGSRSGYPRAVEPHTMPRLERGDSGRYPHSRHDWGTRTLLFEADGIRIERLEIKPGGGLVPSVNKHHWVHWVVTEGMARITIGDVVHEAGPNESRYVAALTRHAITNPGRTPLVAFELRCGDGSDEDPLTQLAPNDVRATPNGGRPLRVLHVYKTFLSDSMGGLEQAIGQMVSATRRHDVQTRVLSVSSRPDPHRLTLRATENFRFKQSLSIASNSMSLSLLLRFGAHVHWADVVHYHFPWPFADLLHLLWGVRKPSVVTYHSDIIRQQRLMSLYRPLMERFLGRVDRIVATSPNYVQTSDVLRKYADKTTVIPIGLDPASYPATRPEILEHWRRTVGEGYFLFVGVIRYYKGLHILLDALAGTRLRVVIVGAGPIEDELRQHASDMGLSHVKFLGALPDEDKVALFELCSCVVFPSHMRSEAFGVTLVEGAMFGKPLISSEIGTGTSYINVDGVTGLVIRPGDPDALRSAMLRLAGDENLRKQMGQAARRRFEERFTADDMAAQYVATYQQLIRRDAIEAIPARAGT